MKELDWVVENGVLEWQDESKSLSTFSVDLYSVFFIEEMRVPWAFTAMVKEALSVKLKRGMIWYP